MLYWKKRMFAASLAWRLSCSAMWKQHWEGRAGVKLTTLIFYLITRKVFKLSRLYLSMIVMGQDLARMRTLIFFGPSGRASLLWVCVFTWNIFSSPWQDLGWSTERSRLGGLAVLSREQKKVYKGFYKEARSRYGGPALLGGMTRFRISRNFRCQVHFNQEM